MEENWRARDEIMELVHRFSGIKPTRDNWCDVHGSNRVLATGKYFSAKDDSRKQDWAAVKNAVDNSNPPFTLCGDANKQADKAKNKD